MYIDPVTQRINSNELSHHGVLGMKWGIRKYQDKNGKLTSEGKDRYKRDWNSADSAALMPPKDILNDCKEVNGGSEGHDYGIMRNQNCFYCSLAYEYRKRGKSVQSKSALTGVDYDTIDRVFKNENYRSYSERSSNKLEEGMSKNEYNSMVKSILADGRNTRGMVLVRWKAAEPGGTDRGGHAMNYEVRNGTFYLIDGQVGEVYSGKEAYEIMSYANNVNTVRVDNVELHPDAEDVFTEDDKTYMPINQYKKTFDTLTKVSVGVAKEVPKTVKNEVKAIATGAKAVTKGASKGVKSAAKTAKKFFKKLF